MRAMKLMLVPTSYVLALLCGAVATELLNATPPYCFSVVQGMIQGRPEVFVDTEADKYVAQQYALKGCTLSANPNTCITKAESCYVPKLIFDPVGLASNSMRALRIWWDEHVTVYGLVIIAVVVFFAGLVLSMMRTIRELRRRLDERPPPALRDFPPDTATQAVVVDSSIDFTGLGTGETAEMHAVSIEANPKPEAAKEGIDGGLDRGAIKEAFKSRRQEFEI